MAANDQILVKRPHQQESFTEKQIMDIARCLDWKTGPEYFMSNYFYIQHPVKGQMLYKPYEYQKGLIDTYHNYRFSVSMLSRQMGKSVSAAGYLLWYAMFASGAQEIMHRIRYAYELCPNHIRAGSTTYNKGSIEFDNGSRIIAQATTETTGRGLSITLLYCLAGETTVRIRDKETLVEEEISLKDLYTRLYNPTTFLTDELA